MPQSASMARRQVWWLLPLVTTALLVGGCDVGGPPKLAEFPTIKAAPAPLPASKNAGKTNRGTGSEQKYPNEK